MREFIIENLTDNTNINIWVVVINNVVAMITAFFIMFVYKISNSGINYSRKFNMSLGAIAITTTMIMGIISNNIALSLGMVGALSIIRFRTAVKDVRDATFIFWAIAVGIGCGVSQYVLVGIGSVSLLIFMLLTKQAASGGMQMLIVQSNLAAQNQVEAILEEYFEGKAHQTIKNSTLDSCEMVYKVRGSDVHRANEKMQVDIVQRLLKAEGVFRVNLIEQQDDISK